MSSTGRKKDGIWKHFFEIQPSQNSYKSISAKCKKCRMEMAGLVARMKVHFEKCCSVRPTRMTDDDPENNTNSSEDIEEIRSNDTPSTLNSGVTTESCSSTNNSPVLLGGSGESSQVSPESNLSTRKRKASRAKAYMPKSTLDSFVFQTSPDEKRKIDLQISRFIYATNSAFRHIEHPEFIKMVEMLRPGYKPPNRSQIANELLDEVHNSLTCDIKKKLNGRVVCMALDGWSNVHNEAIVCVSVTDVLEESVYLVDTVDTADNSHTGEYLFKLAVNAIKNCNKFNCTVRSFVTDNASNMAKMREQLAQSDELGNISPDIVTYGCSAHLLNLLAHDIDIPGITEHIKQIIKYFRNTHFPAAKYKQAGGKKLILPQDVRWNTLADSLESYIENWHVLSKVCRDNRHAIDSNISSKVHDMNIKINTEDFLKKLKKIAVALDTVQRDTCTISQSTEIWINLVKDFEVETEQEYSTTEVKHCKKRFEIAMTPAHFLANLLDHRYRGNNLTQDQLNSAMEYVLSYHPIAMPDVISYQAKAPPFKDYLFSDHVTRNVKPLTWWLALKNNVSPEMIDLVYQLHSAVASSAGIERLFSSFGFIHSKIRNRLGTEKASKLVSVFKALNKHTAVS